MGGFSDAETNVALLDLLHGGRHLEVWMRRSDLDRRRFDHAWCVIRTDN